MLMYNTYIHQHVCLYSIHFSSHSFHFLLLVLFQEVSSGRAAVKVGARDIKKMKFCRPAVAVRHHLFISLFGKNIKRSPNNLPHIFGRGRLAQTSSAGRAEKKEWDGRERCGRRRKLKLHIFYRSILPGGVCVCVCVCYG